MSRHQRTQQAREALAILRAGQYVAPSGAMVDIRDALARAVDGSRLYLTGERLPETMLAPVVTQLSVANESTLAGARRLALAGERVVALSFASARNPGGGFQNGAHAQEESLARASGLYACIKDSPFYVPHRAQHDASYSHSAIYSPDIPVFRGDDGRLLEKPWPCSFITCAAVNRAALLQQGKPVNKVAELMRQRIERVLGVAYANGHETLVLGAWGCGVFGNDPMEVARMFRQALHSHFRDRFARVHFAVLDREAGPAISAFRSVWGAAAQV